MIKYTKAQLLCIKRLTQYAQVFADVVYDEMVAHDLDKVVGCGLMIDIRPEYELTHNEVTYGVIGSEAGFFRTVKGNDDEKYRMTDGASAAFKLLFADKAVKEIVRNVLKDYPAKADEILEKGLIDDDLAES